ncbi:MAG: transglutaminase domain-containing protein [Spirochaetales bacterium]|nr:transglutaminase domain-containing protein [Spirochaetales bacterium]
MVLKKIFNAKVIRHILVYIVVFTLPVLTKRIFHAGIPFYVILIILAIKFIFVELSLLSLKKVLKIIFIIISSGLSILFTAILLASIIITPASIYTFFFEQAVNPITEEYFVATLFVLLVTYFCMFFGSASIKQNSLKPLLGLLSMICGIPLIIYQNVFFLFLLIACLVIFLTVIMKKRIIILASVFSFCIVISMLFYLIWNKPEGNKFVDTYLFPETRNFINKTFPQFPLLIDIPGYGMNYGASKLGGRSILTSAPVFEVQGNRKEAIYFKTNTYDQYTGHSWLQTEDIIDDPVPAIADAKAAINDGRIPDSDFFTVKILSEVFPIIPYTLDTEGFIHKGSYYNISNSRYLPGIVFREGIKRNDIITLFRMKEQQVFLEDLDKFLQIPPNLPDSIKELATILGQNASSVQEILRNIQAFLAAYYIYNLDPPVKKDNEDFLENFLFETKQGYCTHFATAFTIFARLNGIPVRYVTGYLVYITDNSLKKTVTARTAHAWPEIWLPGHGWEVWESTHAVNRDNYDSNLESFYYRYMFESMIRGNEIARNYLTLNQLQDILGIELRIKEKEEMNFDWVYKVLIVLLYIFLVILGLGIAGGLLYLFIRFLFNWKPERYWRVLLNRLVRHFRQVPLPEKTGWVSWKHNVCSFYKIDEKKADALLAVILKGAYSQNAVSREEITILKSFHR